MTIRRFVPALLTLPMLIGLTACQPGAPLPGSIPDPNARRVVLEMVPAELALHVIQPVYQDLDEAAATLYTAATALQTAPTDAALESARQAWRAARKPWELSEGHLLGPVKDQDLDPQLDSWPLNRTDVDKVLAGSEALTADLIAKQSPSMKGFHAIEYILFGAGTQPKAKDLTPRQLAYLTALTGDFRRVAADLRKAWAPEGGNYVGQFVPPANAKTALAEVLTAMGEICEEVADAKIETPLAAKDRTLEESLFSNNSMEDFRHNLEGVQNVYLGSYKTAGQGLSALVLAKDPALDARVRQQFRNVQSSMAAVTVPFGDAITSQPEQLRRVQAEFRALRQLIGQEVTLVLLGQASADKT